MPAKMTGVQKSSFGGYGGGVLNDGFPENACDMEHNLGCIFSLQIHSAPSGILSQLACCPSVPGLRIQVNLRKQVLIPACGELHGSW